MFNRKCASIIFMDLQQLSNNKFMVTEKIIFDCFVFSMMTVLDEYKNMNKYNYLVFVEFQELICRLALTCFKEYDTVEWKVCWLLDFIFEK